MSSDTALWWKDEVVCQVFLKSFFDSNGDGKGDLKGFCAKLPYLISFGVSTIVLSPVFDSPQVDGGFDVANFMDIYAPFGDLDDMAALFRTIRAHGMHIIMDMVLNHTSDQHKWFKESRSSRSNPYRTWYIWRPAKYALDGTRLPPNNWRSEIGNQSAWEWDEATQEYYLHLFSKEQPDLNWDNDEVRRAMLDVLLFWLGRRVDGFRLNSLNLISKPEGLPDAPIVDADAEFQPVELSYRVGPHLSEYLAEINEAMAPFGAVIIAEVPSSSDFDVVLASSSSGPGSIHMVSRSDIANIDTTRPDWNLSDLKAAVGDIQSLRRRTGAWTTVMFENHDLPRSVSRFCKDGPEDRVGAAKLLALLQVCLSGTLFLYQGQELGCVNAQAEQYALSNFVDVKSQVLMAEALARSEDDFSATVKALERQARDHARIPIAWKPAQSLNYFGFSQDAADSGEVIATPWMAPHPLASETSVGIQMCDVHSVHSYWEEALYLRKRHHDLLVHTEYAGLREHDRDLFMFTKTAQDGRKAFVVLNFTSSEKTWAVPDSEELGWGLGMDVKFQPLQSTCRWRTVDDHGCKEAKVALGPWEGRLYLVSLSPSHQGDDLRKQAGEAPAGHGLVPVVDGAQWDYGDDALPVSCRDSFSFVPSALVGRLDVFG